MSKDCFEIPLEDIETCPNEETQAGLSPECHFSPTRNIESIPLPEPPFEKMEDSATIDGSIVMKEEHVYAKIDLQADLNDLNSALIGNKGNKKDQTTLNIFVPGMRAKLIGFKKMYKNVKGSFIIDDNNGNLYVLGTPKKPAYIDNFEISTGQGEEDNNGATGTIVCNDIPYVLKGSYVTNEHPAPTDIDVTPATEQISQGEWIQMTAQVNPPEAPQDVKWEIEDPGDGMTISKDGLILTTESTQTSVYTVNAVSKVKPTIVGTTTVEVTA